MNELRPWMWWLLRIAGTYNILSGLGMLVGYHEVYRIFGVSKPSMVLPLQMLGAMIVLFGVGFHMAASAPLANRAVLVLGFWSKLLGFVLSAYTVWKGQLPLYFVAIVFFADLIYVPTFWLILRHLRKIER
jgi:hypothetical protein